MDVAEAMLSKERLFLQVPERQQGREVGWRGGGGRGGGRVGDGAD